MSADLDEALIGRLADRDEIANVLARHSRGVDRADYPLLRSAYADDGEVAYGFFTGPAETFARILADAQKPGAITLHRTSNMWIRLEGGAAISESHVTAYTQTPDEAGPTQRLIGGRYLDRHARTEDGWRLKHRTYVLDWNMNWPGASAWHESAAEQMTPRGGHGPADIGAALIALWRAGAGLSAGDTAPMTAPQTASPARTLDALASRQAIHDLMMAYCRAVDRGDEASLAALFHPDATVVSGLANGSPETFAKQITAVVTGQLASCSHTVANEWIEVNGDQAVAESYVIAFTLSKGEAARQAIVGGRYLDRFERRGGEWKFRERVFVMDYNIDQPSTAQFGEGMYASLTTRGGFKPNDPVFEFWDAQAS